MTLGPRRNVLLTEDGSQHVRAAVERYRAIPLLPESRILIFHAFHFGWIL